MNEPLELKRKDLQTQIMELRTQVENLRFEHKTHIDALLTRIQLLEASSAARQQAFEPGRIQTMYEGDLLTIYGMGTDENSVPDIRFMYDKIRHQYSLHGSDGQRPITIENITPQQIRHLIGAALAVLKHMEATPDAE